jgi:flagellar basal-body rod protein FlgG
MERGLYIAASGMLAEQVRQDQIANDLANASTPGYKADRSAQASFADLLLSNSQTGEQVGSLSMGARIARVVTDLSQGPLQQTGDPLDLALQGDGFLAVSTPAGTRYTRDGQLALDDQGRLVTVTGYVVLGTDGRPITAAGLRTPDDLQVSQAGVVSVRGRTVGTIDVASLTGAAKEGDTLFTGTAGPRPTATTIAQGYLEGSGVEPARAMVDMIVSLRAYESSQRVLHAIDDTLGRATQSVGSATG